MELLKSMFLIEKGFGTENNESEYSAYIVLAESDKELRQAKEKYGLELLSPENEERIATGQEIWQKQTYIQSDTGEGIFLYFRLARACKNDSEKARKTPT